MNKRREPTSDLNSTNKVNESFMCDDRATRSDAFEGGRIFSRTCRFATIS